MKAKNRALATALVLMCLAAIATSASAAEEHVLSLVWKPTSDVNDLPSVFSPERWTHDYAKDPPSSDAFEGLRVQVLPFIDARTEKTIGSNTEEHWPRPITTKDDVAAFVSSHLGEVLQAAHVNVVASGATRLLRGEVRTFFVDEDNTYRGTVILQLTLTDAQGHELWQGPATGHSKRFGHSLSEENYNETFSDSLVDAVTDLLKNHAFLRAAARRSAKTR